jgi:predicted TIM-barrel fold metal-dependent hydrolase
METVMNDNARKVAEIRRKLGHPILDGDGHILEFVPAFLDYIKQVGGPRIAERYLASLKSGGGHNFDGGRTGGAVAGWYGMTPEQRRDKRLTRPSFWNWPTGSTLDRATIMLPDLLRARLDEIGIDFSVVYTSMGLHVIRNPDEEIRRAGCRALNLMYSEIFHDHAARMTPAALIPMHTPQEAIEELDYAVKTLGLKAIMIGSIVRRPIPEVLRNHPEAAGYAFWLDNLALGSIYDYDPFWARCVEHRIAVTAHSGTLGAGARAQPENFTYNHIGHFAAAGEAFCKGLVMGGVTQRFPTLNFAFLEGGVGWAVNLYNDIVEHWEKRNRKSMDKHLNPRNLDHRLLRELFEKHGGKVAQGRLDRLGDNAGQAFDPVEDEASLDEWSAVKIEKASDIYDLFVPNFYFGCEADDRMTSVAFNERLNHFGAKLKPLFSSDIGHWDVPDITEVVLKAYELVEHDLLTEEDFRDFMFANPARLHGSMNPDFFKGTVVEDAAAKLMQEKPPARRVRQHGHAAAAD